MFEIIGTVLLVANLLAMAFLKRHVEAVVDKRLRRLQIDMEWEQKVREQASKVAEYLSIAHFLKSEDPAQNYARANQLIWELAMFLPAETYKTVTGAVMDGRQTFKALLEVRQYLVGSKLGVLTEEDLAMHAPGIGRKL